MTAENLIRVHQISIEPGSIGAAVVVTARAMSRAEDDYMHYIGHSFTSEATACETCSRVRARQERWAAKNPPCECDCCVHNA